MTDNISIEKRAMALLARAFDLPEDRRTAFVIAQAAQDEALAARTLALLESDSGDSAPVVTAGAASVVGPTSAPDQIGPYRLTRMLGEGGMGAVYLGERIDRNFSQRVAIKLVRGLTVSQKLSHRLREERQVLAQLSHPNIAQLYDGGELKDGSPYFIMEYVEGHTLDDYAVRNRPSFDQRLNIFTDILSAVAYAHRNLIIHRDLSVANAIVSNEGVVKLIDFGISHTLSPDTSLRDGPRRTITKGFAAPEQARGDPTSTLSDIYSLGVILRKFVAVGEHQRAADLQAIIDKASADEPDERYQSVETLAEEISRFRIGYAVEARSRGWTYVATRFFFRHPISVSAAGLAIVGVLASAFIMSLLFLQAERAEARAKTRFDEVRHLAKFMLFDLHDEIAKVPGSTVARERLATTAEQYLNALSRTKDAPISLQLETAISYKRLGDVLGNPIGANLGKRTEARAMLEKAERDLAELITAYPDNADVTRAYADANYSLAVFSFIALDDNARAVELSRKSSALYKRLIDRGEATRDDRVGLVNSVAEEGVALVWLNRGEEAIARLTSAMAELDGLIRSAPGDPALQRVRGTLLINLGDTMSRHFDRIGEGDYEAALQNIEAGVAIYRNLAEGGQQGAELNNSLISALFKLALTYYSLDRDGEALAALDEAITIADMLLVRDPDNIEMKRRRLAVIQQSAMSLAYLGRTKEAAARSQIDIAGRLTLLDTEPQNPGYSRELANAYAMYAEVAAIGDDMEESCAASHRSAELYDRVMREHGVSKEELAPELNDLTSVLEACGGPAKP